VTQRISTSLAGLAAAQTVTSAAALVAAPVLVQHLGLDGYGLIAITATLLLLLSVLDAGLTAALTRRFAAEGAARGAALLAAAERVVLGLAVAGGVLGAALAWPVSAALDSPLPRAMLAQALALAVAAALAFWPATLYQAGLNGRGRQAEAALVQAAGAILRWGGAVLIVAGAGVDVRAVLAWQAVANAAVTVLLRLMLRRGLPAAAPAFAGIRRYATGVSLLALPAAASMVIDRAAGAALLSVAAFGKYTLVAQVAQMLGVLGVTVRAVWFPRIGAALAAGDEREAYRTLGDALQVKAILAVPPAATLALLPGTLLGAWLGDVPLIDQGAAALAALGLGWGIGAAAQPAGLIDLARGTLARVTRLSAASVTALAVLAPLGAWTGGVAGLGIATGAVLAVQALVYIAGPGTPLGAHAPALLRPLIVTAAAAAAPPLLAALLSLSAARAASALVVWAAWLAGCAAATLASATGRMALRVALERVGRGRRAAR
jgi:O-antigen/teichoic acid export membrane protein